AYGARIAARDRWLRNIEQNSRLPGFRHWGEEIRRCLSHVDNIDWSRGELQLWPRRGQYRIGQRNEPMSFTLDDFQGSLAHAFGPGSAGAEQLAEHQDLLERRPQLVVDVGQEALPRVDQSNLAAQ